MQLTERQRDALTELINIGFARAGASLSDLTGQRVVLEVPQVAIHQMNELNQALGRFVTGDVATVHQIFTGPVAGHALLLLDYDGAVALKYLLTDEPALSGRLDASAREVLTEVGNILLNSCLGMFGNLLQVLFVAMEFEPMGDPAGAWMTPLAHRQFFPQEWAMLLHYNGFAVERVDGDFHGGPVSRDSDVMVWHARRRGRT